MKLHKSVLLLVPVSLLAAGCFGPDVAKTMQAIGKDDATWHVTVKSVYGTVDYVRTNPHLDSLPHAITPEGGVTVSGSQQPATSIDVIRAEQLRHLDNILNNRPPTPPLPQ